MRFTIAAGHGLDDVLATLCEGREVFALTGERDGRYRLVRGQRWDPQHHTLGPYRPVDPVKSVLFPPRERLGAWGDRSGPARLAERIVLGVKNCDLSALEIQDHVFLEDGPIDPHYAEARDKTLFVASDCTDHLDACFCPAVGEQPYAKKGFDINFSVTHQGYVIEAGSERGARALTAAEHLLAPAGDELLAARETDRADMLRRLSEHSAAHGLAPGVDLRGAVEGAFDSDLWERFAADCVECGACNFACCTCHCFLLADGHDDTGCPVRNRQWDACLFRDFARTAGGGNPRPRRAQRLRNRFDKKFSYFPEVLGRYACDGCGRCTEACIAAIDIRAVLKRAVDESITLHAHSGDG